MRRKTRRILRIREKEKMEYHNIQPVFDENSEILILGSFPSVKSREAKFFYGHPQNRFWRVTAALMNEETPRTIEEKRAFLLRNKIAVWDVIGSCDITGSSDSSIKNVVPNDISVILNNSNVKRVFTNGAAAYNLYKKHIEKAAGREAVRLPSTSPANAAYSVERLISEWRVILG